MGLLRAVLRLGGDKVNIQTTTPVLSVSSTEGVNIVSTASRGAIRAKKVVYATNAYTFGLVPEYAPSIIPAKGIVAHISTPGGKKPPLLSQTYILRPDASDGADYMIVRPDGSIIIGGAHQIHTFPEKGAAGNAEWFGNVDDSSLIESTKAYWDGYMQRYFHGWEDTDAKVEKLWTGSASLLSYQTDDNIQMLTSEVMGYSSDSAPHIGQVPSRPNQFIAAGFNGHGMPVIFLSTKGLADMILHNTAYAQTGLPRIYKTSAERLEAARIGKEGGDILHFEQ